MDECELIAFISASACAISKCCSNDEISILSAVFTQLGDTLATILAKRDLNNNPSNNGNNYNDNICKDNNCYGKNESDEKKISDHSSDYYDK